MLKNIDPTAHAEIMTARDACKNIKSYDLAGCELFTSCYPSPMWLSAIIWSNINVVYYCNTKEYAENIGFRDKYIYDVISKINNGNAISLKLYSIDRDEIIKTFNDFIDKNDKTIY